jgi:predicted exporter
MTRRGAAVVACWLLCIGAASWIVAGANYVTDLSAFLPAHPTPAQQLLVDQLREGPASRLILCGIEGGDAEVRANVSIAAANRLRASPQFLAVDNGAATTTERDREFLFEHRYALSPRVDAQRFSVSGLRQAIGQTIDDLASPAGLLLKSLVPRDPTGEMLQIVARFQHGPGPASIDAAWSSRDGSRALLIAETRAAGSDTDAQQQAMASLTEAFTAARAAAGPAAAGLRLKMSGPGVFAVRARSHIQQAAVRLSLASSILIVILLLAVYRSIPAVALGLLPVASGALAGVAAVALGFGTVHGITLGFGITLIGESVDYSIYFFVQSQGGNSAQSSAGAWRRDVWPTVRLGVLTSICGFASLLASGFPGLAQLGAYSISGLIAAALVTRFVLPEVVPATLAIRDVAPWGARVGRALAAIPYPRSLAAVVVAAAVLVLTLHHATLWNRELSALSPVSLSEQQYDAALRADLGTADVRDLIVVTGASLEAVLQDAERVATTLDRLVDDGLISGFDSPANIVPSLAAQTRRRESLPDAPELRARLSQATADLGLDPASLTPFIADVEAARHAAPIAATSLQGTSLAAAFDALILHEGRRWSALLPLHAPIAGGAGDIDSARLGAALRGDGIASATILDLKLESDSLYSAYLREAIELSLAGIAAIVLLLCIALRSATQALRVLAPLVIAVLCVAAALSLAGQQLTILHLVGMLLVVAVGSNYALFFAHVERGHAPLTIAALVIANVATVIGFGLLSFSQVPVLEALGMTVAPGALLALVFSAVLSAPERRA